MDQEGGRFGGKNQKASDQSISSKKNVKKNTSGKEMYDFWINLMKAESYFSVLHLFFFTV